ncbi:hypothetical protein MKEN_00331100 [Mycena kentingensis (nom. inval.)]|nr:hypothetical protein MKEN_00331100 [Mycena kentingensis (nom. inval.)]
MPYDPFPRPHEMSDNEVLNGALPIYTDDEDNAALSRRFLELDLRASQTPPSGSQSQPPTLPPSPAQVYRHTRPKRAAIANQQGASGARPLLLPRFPNSAASPTSTRTSSPPTIPPASTLSLSSVKWTRWCPYPLLSPMTRDAYYIGEDDDEYEADHGLDISADGQRVRRRFVNIEPLQSRPPEDTKIPVVDEWASWMPGAQYGAGSEIAASISTLERLEWDLEDVEEPSKRKRYESDDPNGVWRRGYVAEYLDALVRRAGLGDYVSTPKCSFCETVFVAGAEPLFRCEDCGQHLQCKDCLATRHRLSPLHTIKDRYKQFGRMTRQYSFLGRLQTAGRAHARGPDTSGNVAGSAAGSASASTSGDGDGGGDEMGVGEDGAGRSAAGAALRNDSSGVEQTGPGELAIWCWTCPRPGYNLPEGWELIEPAKQYLNSVTIAMDANFRLKNRIRANERPDSSFGPGWGTIVEKNQYQKHLREYVVEEDVSTCIAFAALMQKETRITTGLRVSGVGGCVCARHGLVRPLGLGDLQKGERYSNMDYILISALRDIGVKRVVVSYDIACQWKQKLLQRARTIAPRNNIPTNLDDLDLGFGLPVWHAIAHEPTCQAELSLTYVEGVGRTDGEGIERTWAVINPISYATKEMSDGNRHDTFETKVQHVNEEKNYGQGDLLSRKLIVGIAAYETQLAEFMEMDESLDDEVRAKWTKQVEEWEQDHTRPNPYLLDRSQSGGSEAQVLAELKEQELQELREGREDVAEGRMTAAAFIKGKLQLEGLQRRIRAEVRGQTLTADRLSQLNELRVSFFKKMRVLMRLEGVYMPGVAALRQEEEDARDPDLPAPKAEDTTLWFPSQVGEDERERVCVRGLTEVEARLRRAQCWDAIADLRAQIHGMTQIVLMRNSQMTGQRGNDALTNADGTTRRQAEGDGGKIPRRVEGDESVEGHWLRAGIPGANRRRPERQDGAGERRRSVSGVGARRREAREDGAIAGAESDGGVVDMVPGRRC